MICATLAEPTLEGMVEEAGKTAADLVELRLDFLEESEPDLTLIKKVSKPVVATCMPEWEGGKFKGTEQERVNLLTAVLPNADYVTIELKAEKNLRDALTSEAKKLKVKVILAHHDFERTPALEEIQQTLKREEEAGADVAKVAYNPEKPGDVLTVLQALAEPKVKVPVIALSMGELGRASRILSPMLGGFLTFAAVSAGKRAAPGQLTVGELTAIQANLKQKI